MSLRRFAGAVAAVAVGALVLAGPASAQEVDDVPTLRTERPVYDRGQSIRVEGEGWPGNTVLTVELCGNEAANGSVDCDARNAKTVATTRDGALFVDLLATSPPSPCPCVVHVFLPGGDLDLAVRVGINGVPTAPVEVVTGPARQLDVTSASLDGGSTLGSWFGGAPTRTLRLTIENTGDVALEGSALRVGWGRPSDPSRVVDAPNLERLEPGESVEVEVPVTLAPLAWGDYVAAGRIAGFEGSQFEASTTSYPWGLILLPLVLVGVVVGAVVIRSRRGVESEGAASAEPSDGGDAAARGSDAPEPADATAS